MSKKKVLAIEKKAGEFLDMLALIGDVVVEEADGGYKVSIETDDSNLLIGYHGENLESFQLILVFLVSHELGQFYRITVNVGDYRERREEKLQEMATKAKEEVLETKREITLANLSSSDRRIIHLFLQDDQEVYSESVGEGNERHLVIKPKQSA